MWSWKKPRPRLRALVLAAGLGRRLRPLTAALPKPLLPVAGRPLAHHTLARLAAAGCEAAALNLHHQGERIRERFGDSFEGMSLTYSQEPELLGTLGAMGPLREFLAEADLVLVINGDSLCRWPFKRLVRRHLRSGARATLLLARRPDPAPFGGGVGVDDKGRIVSLSPGGPPQGEAARHMVFAGAHVVSPDLLKAVEARPSDVITDLYEPLLAAGSHLQGVPTSRCWHDLGTPGRYLAGLLDWVRGPWPFRRSWVSPRASVGPGARIRGSVVEAGARVEGGARLSGAAVLPGARVGRGARLSDSILGPEAALPDGARIEGRLITVRHPGADPAAGDSVVGGLVYTLMS